MKKIFGIILGLLFCSMGIAQETPTEPTTPTTPSQAATPTKRASKFQGLWQQRKGHNLRLDYGVQTDLWAPDFDDFSWAVEKYLPLRFDLEYQYDIPWNPKRINFYAYAGIAYKRLEIDYFDFHIFANYPHLVLESSFGGYFGIGLKVHCTDWLHLSFSQALNLMYKDVHIQQGGDKYFPGGIPVMRLAVGSQTSIRIVGQVKQWSIFLGYRIDHWQKTVTEQTHYSEPLYPISGSFENYLTIGVGYDF